MIYLNDLKKKKLFFKMTTFDLAFLGVLLVVFVIYSTKILSIKPLLFPLVYFILTFRFLENEENLWNHVSKFFDYLINSQQVYYWRRDDD